MVFTVAPNGGTYTVSSPSSATATIADNDAPAITVTGTNGAEGGVGVTISFTRTGPTTLGLAGVMTSRIGTWTADLGAAIPTGGTYNSVTGEVTFNPGVATVVFTFPVVNDSDVEGTETFGFNVLAGAATCSGRRRRST